MIPLLFLRHGMTEWNEQKRLQGHTDIPLSARGRSQIANWSLPAAYDDYECVCSPLTRARQTAQLLGRTPRIEPALIEMSWGDWEGQNFAKLQKDLAPAIQENFARGLDFRPHNGESPREVQTRLLPWLAQLNRPTIAVAHRGVLQALHALATDWPMIGKPPDKLQKWAAHLFHIKGGRPQIGTLNIALEATCPTA